MTTQQKARNFINRFARPIDLARWKFHFEGGTKDDVADALAAYQNEDGGFGHGLEADLFNPHSSPIQTCHAIEMLREIGYLEASHPIILGMLRYLDSGADFDEQHAQWLNVLPTNNDYPHAVWWHYGENGSEFKIIRPRHWRAFSCVMPRRTPRCMREHVRSRERPMNGSWHNRRLLRRMSRCA